MTSDLAAQMRATLGPASLAEFTSRGHWEAAPHLQLLNTRLLDLARPGGCRRLLISMPPRHGKSELVSATFPVWWLGNRPDDRIILASYEADFAATWGRRVRDTLDEYGYDLFGIRLRQDSSAANRFDIGGHRGGMVTAGVGGAITGRGAHLLIIDDPVKSAEDAQSDTLSQRIWDWYRSTARTRLEPGGAIVIVMTRWHENDLAGRLLNDPDGEQWEVLNFPALAEDNDPFGREPGEALWPERFDVGALEQTRKALGSYLFSSLYQGRPAPLDGNVFKRSWFRYWTPGGTTKPTYKLLQPEGDPKFVPVASCRRFITVDLAISQRQTADFTVASVWALSKQRDLILLDRFRGRIPGPEQVPMLKRLHQEWEPDFIGIESVAFQMAIIQQARSKGLPIRELKADRDKVSRALIAAARMEGGQIFFPAASRWLDEWESELLLFPNGRHDDQVDTLSYGALEATRTHGRPPDMSGWSIDDLAAPSPLLT